MELTLVGLVRDEGSVVVCAGLDEEGREVTFAADRRAAGEFLAAQEAIDEDITVIVEGWQILGGVR